MSDLEWYLDVGGKQSGPHSAREIVEMVRDGKIPASSQVTAARMNGDWVTAQDLIDAYDELYAKPVALAATDGPSFMGSTTFTAPPRPTEELERSKVFALNREDLEKTPDPTEALFQAIQAVREKATMKTTASNSAAQVNRDLGYDRRGGGPKPRISPQLILIATLAGIFGLTVYGISRLMSGRSESAAKPVTSSDRSTAPAPAPVVKETVQRPSGGLLNDRGGGSSAARTAPPVAPVAPRGMTSRNTGVSGRTTREDPGTRGGGARYRDERDAPIHEPDDLDEGDLEPTRDTLENTPVDPSQVPSDRIIPEMGTIPGRGPRPGTDPNVPPDDGDRDGDGGP